jgi:hypothetical protein
MFLTPKIVYPASGVGTTLNFTYPNVEKPGNDDLDVVRSDSMTLSGLRQSMFIRLDRYVHVVFKTVPMADLPDIDLFMQYALQGGSFLYFPDADSTAYVECELTSSGGSEPTSTNSSSSATDAWSPTFVCRGFVEFEWWLRKIPGGLTGA